MELFKLNWFECAAQSLSVKRMNDHADCCPHLRFFSSSSNTESLSSSPTPRGSLCFNCFNLKKLAIRGALAALLTVFGNRMEFISHRLIVARCSTPTSAVSEKPVRSWGRFHDILEPTLDAPAHQRTDDFQLTINKNYNQFPFPPFRFFFFSIFGVNDGSVVDFSLPPRR